VLVVHHGNRVERLVEALADVVREPAGSVTDPEWIAVQSQGMETWLAMELSRRLGIWANPSFPFPRTLIERLFQRVLGPARPPRTPFSTESMTWAIAAALPARLAEPAFAPLRDYMADDPRGLKRFQLAARIAHTFDQYAVYRPELMLQWGREPEEHWQAQLVHELVTRFDETHVAAVARDFHRALEADGFDPGVLPGRICLFGIAALPPLYLDLLAALPGTTDVHLFVLSPSPAAWASVHDQRAAIRAAGEGDPVALTRDLGLDRGHPLLETLGRLGRESQMVLESRTGYRDASAGLYRDPAEAGQPSRALTRLQSDIFAGRRPGAGEPTAVDDGSIAIHACHGPMREVEVLHDQLLARFEADPTLQPDDVVVMTPDIETYAPYVEAVFGSREGGTTPRIPFSISDRSLRQETPVVDALLAILALVRSRVTATEVLDLLAMDPVRERFELGIEDLDEAAGWVRDAGIRWGIDGEHRRRWGRPGFEQNTWRFGLDRLLLGHAMPGDAMFGGSLPLDVVEGQEAAILGRFVDFCETLFGALASLQTPRSLGAWAATLTGIAGRMLSTQPELDHQHQRVREALHALEECAADAGFDEEVELEVVAGQLGARFDEARSARGFLSGGVTFCNLLPMRSIPFRVIGLLGMGYAEFPRAGHALGFDLTVHQPRLGDRSSRSDDRHLFLEALLAAREHLLITHVGRGIQDNAEIPPSVVVSELLDAIEEAAAGGGAGGEPGTAARQLVTAHPLQPFSPRYFEGDPRLFSHSAGYCAGARALRGERSGTAPPFLGGDLPPLEEGPLEIQLEELVAFYRMPAAHLMRHRIGVKAATEAPIPEDREPLELGALDAYQVRGALLERTLARVDDDEAFQRTRAEGLLPLGTPGRSQFDQLRDEVEPFAAEVAALRAGAPHPPIALDLRCAGARITGHLGDIWTAGRLEYTAARVRAKHRLTLWIRHLALNAAAPAGAPRRSVLLGRGQGRGVERFELAPVEDATTRLAELAAIYRAGLCRPLPFFPQTSLAYARTMRELAGMPDAEVVALDAARGEWYSGWNRAGEGEDPSVARLFGGADPLEGDEEDLGFHALALRVFEPLLESSQ